MALELSPQQQAEINRLQEARKSAAEATDLKVLAGKRTALAAGNDDYLDMQQCLQASGSFTSIFEIGLWVTGWTCPDRIMWFVEGVDFTLVDVTEGSIEVSRDDVDSNTAVQQTRSGKVTHSRKWAVLPTLNGRLWQKMLDIQMRDAAGPEKGKLYQNYSDGGMHMRMSHVLEDGSFGIREVALNVKVPTWPDVMYTDFRSTDAKFDFECTVEWGEKFEMVGVVPEGFATPTSATAITIENDGIEATEESIVISSIVLNDPMLYAFNERVKVQVIDAQDNINAFIVESGADLTIPAADYQGQDVTIQFGYYATEDFVYYIGAETIDVPLPPDFIEAVGAITVDSQTADSVTGSYELTMNDATAGSVSLNVVKASDASIAFTQIAIEGGASGTITGLEAETNYRVELKNTVTGTLIASDTFTTTAVA